MINTRSMTLIKKLFTIKTIQLAIVVVLISVMLFSSISAQATPASARSAIKGGYPLYVSGDGVGGQCSTTTSTDTLVSTGDELSRKKAIWAYLRTKMNLSAPQAAGAMGNLKQENSTFDPTVRQNNPPSPEIVVDGKSGYGIVQWTSRGRQQSLEDFAKEISQSSGNLDTQLQFITKEVNAGYKEMLAALTATDDPAEAAKIWHGPTNEASSIIPRSTYDFAGYEASGDDATGIQERIDSAIGILNELGDGSDSYAGPTCTPSDGAADSTNLPSKDGWVWPINGATRDDISFDYGELGCGASCGTHKAIDIPYPKGTDVFAAHKGVVSKVANMGSCGYATLIKVSDIEQDIWIEYQHMDPTVEVGQEVEAGKQIGDVGKFCGSGYHLHFGLSKRNAVNSYDSDISYTIDPKSVLP